MKEEKKYEPPECKNEDLLESDGWKRKERSIWSNQGVFIERGELKLSLSSIDNGDNITRQ